MENREMYAEVNALVGAVAKALDVEVDDAVRAIEAGQLTMAMETDERGHRYISVEMGAKTARVYQGAIQYAPEQPEPAEDEGCGHGGCGCGGR